MFVNDFEKKENNNNVFILKQISSVVLNKQSAEKNLSAMMIK